ncbi:MAG: hypothetical protein ISS29_06845 [Candidatus Marinimicrobia bacterium]|nr:hypothetical protein [Candidatus Neomarinimicrobiota bacterium]
MFFNHISKIIVFYQSEHIRLQTFVCIQNGLFYHFLDEQSRILLQSNRYPSQMQQRRQSRHAAAGKDDDTIFYRPRLEDYVPGI